MIFRELRSDILRIPLIISTGEKIFIEINLGVAFGIGSHPTTRLCIKGLETIFKGKKKEKVLDVGCGTGVLALCAAALGANMVLALDIDHIAVEEAKINTRENGFSSKIQVVHGSLESVIDTFDLVLANITACEILRISHELINKLKNGGLLLISGFNEYMNEKIVSRFQELRLILYKEFYEVGLVALLFKKI